MVNVAMAARFMALFSGLDRAYGVYNTGNGKSGEKIKGRALTEHKTVTVELWLGHLQGKQGIGIVPIRDDNAVSWAAIDIDKYDGLDLGELEVSLKKLNLPLLVARSKSGGAHLFLFCAEALPARYIRNRMTEWAVQIGYPKSEIFPKQDAILRPDDVGNWINMPYFDAEHTTRYAIFDNEQLSAEEFLDLAESRQKNVTKAKLDAFSAISDDYFADGPPCLQHLVKKGFPRGSRNKGLFNLGVLARLASGDDWQARVDEMNHQYMQPPVSSIEVGSTLKSLSRKNYFYTCSQDPIASVCQKDLCKTRKFGIGNNETTLPPINIDFITKVNSDPPIWRVSIEGHDIECTAGDLLNQPRFRVRIMEKLTRVVPLLNSKTWESLINGKLANAEIEDAPLDSGPEGQFQAHFENFCTSRVTANSLDEVLLGKPFLDQAANRTYFRSPDLLRYLETQHFREYTERQVWAIVKKMGGTHHKFTIKGKGITAWSIPSFQKQTGEFETPAIEGDDL